jgi:SAM-dependent methyltransferase
MGEAAFEIIDGIRCYAPEVARADEQYPSEGFDVTDDVERTSFWCRSRNRLLVRMFHDLSAGAASPLDVLEIGCGTGFVLEELSTVPNLRLTGSEVYLRGLRYARMRRPEIEFVQLDATRMPFRERFDVVGAFDVLEHIEEDRTVIRNVRAALRPGGRFIVMVPQYPFLWSELDELVHHRRRYRRKELVEKLLDAGFEVPYVGSYVFTLFPLMIAARMLKRRRDTSRTKEQAFREHVQLPGTLNRAFDLVMHLDEFLISRGVSLPFGGSLIAIARRR